MGGLCVWGARSAAGRGRRSRGPGGGEVGGGVGGGKTQNPSSAQCAERACVRRICACATPLDPSGTRGPLGLTHEPKTKHPKPSPVFFPSPGPHLGLHEPRPPGVPPRRGVARAGGVAEGRVVVEAEEASARGLGRGGAGAGVKGLVEVHPEARDLRAWGVSGLGGGAEEVLKRWTMPDYGFELCLWFGERAGPPHVGSARGGGAGARVKGLVEVHPESRDLRACRRDRNKVSTPCQSQLRALHGGEHRVALRASAWWRAAQSRASRLLVVLHL